MYVKQTFPKPDKIIASTAAVASPGVALSVAYPQIYGRGFSIEALTDDVFISLGSGTAGFKVTGVTELVHPPKGTTANPGTEVFVYGTGAYQVIAYSDNP